MMRNLLIFLTAVFLLGCSSGKQALQRGDYYEAVMKSINRLKSDPRNAKAATTLKEAYPLAVEDQQTLIDFQLSSDEPFKWSNTIPRLETINRMAYEISRCPAARKIIVTPKRFVDELHKAKKSAAQEQYLAGINSLSGQSREDYKQAYYFFKKANHFVNNYKDSSTRMAKALQLATIHVVLEPTIIHSELYTLSLDFFDNNMLKRLRQQIKAQPFVRYYSSEEAAAIKLQPDHVVTMQFVDFVIGETHTYTETRNVESSDSVKVGEIKIGNKTKSVYNIVKAKVKIHKQEIISGGILKLTVEDYQQRLPLVERPFRGSYKWVQRWGSFNGDERALNSAELRICEHKPHLPPPPQEMFIAFTDQIYDQSVSYLRNYYRKY